MADIQTLLHKLHPTQHNNEYQMDFEFVGVSQQYNMKQYIPSVYPSSTIRSFIATSYPSRLAPDAITIGYGVLTNKQPHSIKWSTLSSLDNTTFQDIFGPIKISGSQSHLLICNLFSKLSFRSELADLRRELEKMNDIRLQLTKMESETTTKWTPP